MVTQGELLKNANKLDAPRINAIAAGGGGKKSNAVVTETKEAVEPAPLKDLVLVHDNDDPFSGNMNNRAVAERIAKQPGRIKLNGPAASYAGDPQKAANDVAKSYRVNPPAKGLKADELPEVELPEGLGKSKESLVVPPSNEGAAPGSTTTPPVWKPQA